MFWLMVFSPLIIFTTVGISGGFHSLNNSSMTYAIAAFGIAQTLFVVQAFFMKPSLELSPSKAIQSRERHSFGFLGCFLPLRFHLYGL